MEKYLSKVIDAEKQVFGGLRFSPPKAQTLSIKNGDLNRIEIGLLADALRSDVYVVFGASFIKGPLIDFLVANKAINIHMGISPYYRGSSCNFWAIYDGNPDLVGATVHLLSRNLDSGPMLFHAPQACAHRSVPVRFPRRPGRGADDPCAQHRARNGPRSQDSRLRPGAAGPGRIARQLLRPDRP